jgi:hypothetical protein
VSGIYIDAGVFHGFSRSADGKIARFDAPGACANCTQGTRPSTNNAEGEVVGWEADEDTLLHGFIWIPDVKKIDASRKQPANAGTV